MAINSFRDRNITDLLESRSIDARHDINLRLQMHSSLVQRLSLEKELEGHEGCVNSVAWNSKGTLLISGSDDTRINIWNYSSKKLFHSIDTGHSANIFCTKFVPETSDELVVSGAGDAEVRLFNLSRLNGRRPKENAIQPSALFQCHSRRVKKLAVEIGNPNVVWSASEDGTLRQHDLREGVSCPPAGSSHQECRNVLDYDTYGLVSCDAFARLYDRRMLPPPSSCQKKMKPPPCVNYFCPMHLSERGSSSLHLTHVAFSPNGEEVLLSYSGEHVYLMDVNPGGEGFMRYTAEDVPKQISLTPILNQAETKLSCALQTGYPRQKNVNKCKGLVQAADKILKEGTNYLCGIEACNEVLDGIGNEAVRTELKYECLCTRAALFLKRKWKNDVHMAIRDCNKARSINPSSFLALYHMSDALLQLGKHKEALEFALVAQNSNQLSPEAVERVETIKERLAAANDEKNNKENDRASRYGTRPGRIRSLSDMLHQSHSSNDTSQNGPRSEREDSDSEEEMEMEFETSISGEEARNNESNILRGNLNLRFHRRGESCGANVRRSGSCESSSSSQIDYAAYQPEEAVDMGQRYTGHCNLGTDIKQASFLGQRGEYIASGSDDGRWFIWDKKTGILVKMLAGDEAAEMLYSSNLFCFAVVVNCVQCHPSDCTIATSGIDSTIKIWTPWDQTPSIVAGGMAGPEPEDVYSVMERNQNRLRHNRDVILPLELLERFRMHEFAEGTLHPFECAQT
ncbi:hypothetical protein GIB67_019611 [Kingdonia uniflora]|uniref:WD and tetratricopeptide repeats protein 1 n=1 Tax=Kingdonia uniflora TaxID=39325 RepID=A0A7J7N0E7_9MAGN|nr:hypothetical protein GIB67_019611 [Kingdonia uniflora]